MLTTPIEPDIGSAPVPDIRTMQHPITTVRVGIAVMLVVFVPLAVDEYTRTSSK